MENQKQCRRCYKVKSVAEFQIYSRNKDGLQPYCCDCKRQVDREHYERNPRRNYERNKAAVHRNRIWLYEFLKTKKCEWEGCTVDDPDMLVLDHLNPEDKRGNVSYMAQSSYSLRTIKAEVEKCRVLCANHHQKHTIHNSVTRNGLKVISN